MDHKQPNHYLATKVLTAKPEELRLMLLEGAVKFARQGREGLATKNFEATFNGFSRCRDILFELMNTMKPHGDPALTGRIASLYGYLVSRLLEASTERSLEKADEVISLLDYERETWVMVMAKLAEERRAAAGAPAPSAQFADPSRPVALSIEG